MGVTVAGVTVRSHLIPNDDDNDVHGIGGGTGVKSAALNSMGTSPVVNDIGGNGGKCRVKVTSGTGVPAIAANNVVLTLETTRTPRKVFLAASDPTPGFHVLSVGAGTISIGTKVAPAVSTVYNLEVIVVF